MRWLHWSIGRWWSAAVRLAAVGPVLLAPLGPVARAAESGFTERVVDPHAGEICYAATLADIDGDGRQDIVVVTENAVFWYGNPGVADGAWRKHIVIHDQTPRGGVGIAACSTPAAWRWRTSRSAISPATAAPTSSPSAARPTTSSST
jgi:hypothetical protein